MLEHTVELQLDLIVFCLAMLAGATMIQLRLRHVHQAPGLTRGCWITLLLVMVVAAVAANSAETYERGRLRAMLEGYAPTYASDMTLLGHSRLPDDVPPDDALYLKLIEVQKSWLAANPAVCDVYTIRRAPDARHFLLVDSETDYDGSGAIDRPVEQRTPIGEVLDNDYELIEQAFQGYSTFADRPTHDRWGYWISAYAPICDQDGQVEAVLGVDFAATRWYGRLMFARLAALGMVGIAGVTFLAASSVTTLAHSEAAKRAQAERVARISEARLREIIDAEPESVMVLDRNGKVLECNPAALRVIEADSIEQLSQADLPSTIEPEYRQAYLDLHRRTLAGESGRLLFCCRSLKGRRLWVEKSSMPLRDDTGRIYAALSIGRDITSQLQAEQERERLQGLLVEELRRQAMEDKLTGLANRRAFTEQLAVTVSHAANDHSYHFAVLFLDFDRFKLVNDSLGHEIGDLLLIEIARRIREVLDDQPVDPSQRAGRTLAARLGGDEFIILLDQLSTTAEAERVARELLSALGRPYVLKGHTVHTSASIGITSSDIAYTNAGDVIRDADTAMYRAKTDGKGRCVFFDHAMHREALRRLTLEAELRQAIGREELYLEYQPIISLESGRTTGLEALVRWKRRNGEIVPPSELIPMAEEIGKIGDIGAWVLETACRQLATWRARHPEMESLNISINLSRRQLNSELPGQVWHTLKETGLPPSLLTLEITESTMMEHGGADNRVLRQLREIGVQLHMDDFGTGYSSLSCLHRFPIDGVKIDRAFIDNVSERRDYAAVVNAIVSLAHNLGVELIAEGVETAEQIAMLQALGCDSAQGYYFARPVPTDAVPAALRQISTSVAA